MSTAKETRAKKNEKRLRTLTDEAITVVRQQRAGAFTKGWLGKMLVIDREEASQVVSQLKKDEFIHHETTNWGDFQDPRNRGKYYCVREAPQGWYDLGWKAYNGK